VTATPRAAVQCPLCGGPNGCMPAQTGCFESSCWCRDVRFDASVLARVPQAQRGLACVCRACACSDKDVKR